jgi:hypothetical protein
VAVAVEKAVITSAVCIVPYYIAMIVDALGTVPPRGSLIVVY